ncbi:hypothetical protein CROQUDRAFT_723694 [Cronartium quercuum f. sp. fusiforme G11]|uniref:Transcription factor IIIC 90kDa subunit N-terminal domain-containing protein n=1 Tax=Cronartium quercuum f. sp. fusiforme G11 TaxID=708437 RepID=A0A9P6NF86_9BASI|nr:hypothetical protein CROQUDRAFT_723694 [Cronartium quercuum f. sp. fusiforme G11]
MTQPDYQPNSIVFRSTTLSTLPLAASGLEWSGDGQALVVTRSNIYLLTPIPDPGSGSGFCSTVIEIDKHLGLPWFKHSNTFAAITPSSIDRFWRAATWSPSALTVLGTSIFAALTTNCDVFIYKPTTDPKTGLWKNPQAVNISEKLLAHTFSLADDDPETFISQSSEAAARRARFTAAVLRAQAISIAWSHPAGPEGADQSLLAVGGRRGDLSLWRYKPNGKMEMDAFESVCANGEGVNMLSWSSWRDSDSQAFLALANSRGQVHVLRVVRVEQAQLRIERELVFCDLNNSAVITNMKWIESEDEPVLVFTRLGELLACSVSPGSVPHVIAIPPPDPRLDWAGASTSWAPCTDLSIVPRTKDIVLSMHNGLLYSATYSTSGLSIDITRSYELSADMRAKLRRLAGRAVTKQDAMKIYGSKLVGSRGLLSWVFEIDEPNYFRYKPENRQSVIFALAPISGFKRDPVGEVEWLLKEPVSCSRLAPVARLLPVLLDLEKESAETAKRMIELLTVDGAQAPSLDSLRLRVTLSRFLLRQSSSAALVDAHVKLSRLIAHAVVQTLSQTFRPTTDFATTARYAHASLTIPQPLEATIPQLLAPEVASHRLTDADRLATSLEGFLDPCPACQVPIPFDNLRLGICGAGHVWDRCAVTFEILACGKVKTCEGCGRKAGVSTETWGRSCAYCGCRWRMTSYA